MTILTVIADVAKVVGVTVPTQVFASTTREHVELAALANEMAVRIGKAHDWTLLRRLSTYTGDGLTTQFALPADYLRMLKKTNLWSSAIQTPLTHISDTDEWLEMQVRSYDYVVGAWTMLGGNIEILPALASAVTAKWYYVSNLIVAPASGANKTAFTADDDSFRLSERVLKLGMIWQWKANKGQAYAEDMTNYENAIEQAIGEDKGQRTIRVGRPRMPRDVSIAYPQNVGP
jgi:hypothetical protein